MNFVKGSYQKINFFSTFLCQPQKTRTPSIKKTGYRLTDNALEILDELFELYLFDRVKEGSGVHEFINLINEALYD